MICSPLQVSAGCSLLTTAGLELVIISWMNIQSFEVMSCNKIKDVEISPMLCPLFSGLKDLEWKPDSKSLFSDILAGGGMGRKGSRFFKKTCDWRSLPVA